MTRRKTQQPSAPSIKALRRNAILNGLADADLEMLAARGTFALLEPRHVVYNANEVIRDVVFPIDCVLSVVTYMHDGGSIEVGTIGYEGVSAIPLLLGAPRRPMNVIAKCLETCSSLTQSASKSWRLATTDSGYASTASCKRMSTCSVSLQPAMACIIFTSVPPGGCL
jgi:hypothetical protein